MKFRTKRAVLVLFIGDLVAFVLGLYLALVVRANGAVSKETFLLHLTPFLFIFAVWTLVFFIADLYRRPTSIFRRRLPTTIFNALLVNSIIAVLFFYLIPYFGITPKTILFFDLIITFALVYSWRRYIVRYFLRGREERVMFACAGPEVDEIIAELKHNQEYNITVINSRLIEEAKLERASVIVINPHGITTTDTLRSFYQMLFSGTRFVNIHSLYEDLFDRVPLSLLTEQWFLENVSNHPKTFYTILKRLMDIVVASIAGVISLIFYPFVWLAIKLDDGGPVFFTQDRVGRGGVVFKIYKFRSMRDDKVTKVGQWLRKTRLDELPQLWSVVSGQQSLVGPRPERPDYVELYMTQIPYYNARHLIAPGLSGWAQIYHDNHPHFRPNEDATKEKLSYDLYYVKSRNLWLDIKIALGTIKIFLSRKGI
jgi:lipopolysaccharide/colanic/teichoic acid biosynthesis glycosyltransferase